jgi:spore coat protein U-like protein
MKTELNKSKNILIKKSKMSLAKTTTALTCLLGVLTISITSSSNAVTTTTGSMAVSSSISSTCTISAASMTFAAYTGSQITANSEITVNCTNSTPYTISFNDAPESTPAYYLYRNGTTSANAADQLQVTFTKSVGSTMTSGAATITGTGTGSNATAGTITGTIAASQTGKTAGTFSKTMTLNIVY